MTQEASVAMAGVEMSPPVGPAVATSRLLPRVPDSPHEPAHRALAQHHADAREARGTERREGEREGEGGALPPGQLREGERAEAEQDREHDPAEVRAAPHHDERAGLGDEQDEHARQHVGVDDPRQREAEPREQHAAQPEGARRALQQQLALALDHRGVALVTYLIALSLARAGLSAR